jgi:hypothetical protein
MIALAMTLDWFKTMSRGPARAASGVSVAPSE